MEQATRRMVIGVDCNYVNEVELKFYKTTNPIKPRSVSYTSNTIPSIIVVMTGQDPEMKDVDKSTKYPCSDFGGRKRNIIWKKSDFECNRGWDILYSSTAFQ